MPPIMPTARPCQTCDGKRQHASLLRKPQVRLDLGGTTTGHRYRRVHAVEPELHQPRGANLNIVHVFQIDQVAAMNANKALGVKRRSSEEIDSLIRYVPRRRWRCKNRRAPQSSRRLRRNEHLLPPRSTVRRKGWRGAWITRRTPKAASILSSAFDRRASSTGLTT